MGSVLCLTVHVLQVAHCRLVALQTRDSLAFVDARESHRPLTMGKSEPPSPMAGLSLVELVLLLETAAARGTGSAC